MGDQNSQSSVKVEIRTNDSQIAEMMDWCKQKKFPVKDVDGEATPNLMAFASLLGKNTKRIFEFEKSSHATMFRLKWA